MREPEPETIRLAQAGDLQAFESIVREQQADVWRFAYHLTRNRATAEDVTQEAFLRAFRALKSYGGQAKFSSWLLRIVRNCAIDAYRRTRLEDLIGDEPVRTARPEATGPGGASEDRIRIAEAVRRLPLELREPFVVIEVLGFNYREASTILGVKTGTLKSRMFRARAALVKTLSEGEAAGEM